MCIFFSCFEPLLCGALWGVIDQESSDHGVGTWNTTFIIIIIIIPGGVTKESK